MPDDVTSEIRLADLELSDEARSALDSHGIVTVADLLSVGPSPFTKPLQRELHRLLVGLRDELGIELHLGPWDAKGLRSNAKATFEKEWADLRSLLEPSVKSYYEVTITNKTPSPWSSQSGRGIELPDGIEWPRDASNRPMAPVAMINLSEMAPCLDEWPSTGLLFFFTGGAFENDEEMCTFGGDQGAVIYVPDANWRKGYAPKMAQRVGPAAQLRLERKAAIVSVGDFRVKQFLTTKQLRAFYDSPNYEALFQRWWQEARSEYPRLGGYASPAQDDPRLAPENRRYDEVLLQWTDDNLTLLYCISKNDLARLSFNDVLFNASYD